MKYETIPTSIIYVNKDMINQRIDNFLKKKFKNIPKSMIYRIIRTGKIRINKKRIKPNYKLKIGDNLKIPSIKVLVEKRTCFHTNNYEKNLLMYTGRKKKNTNIIGNKFKNVYKSQF